MFCKPVAAAHNRIALKLDLHRFTKAIPGTQSNTLTYSLFTDAAALPTRWDLLAEPNVLLSRAYLAVLQKAAPENMQCHFIGLYKNNSLCGIALAQYINLGNIKTFAGSGKAFSAQNYLVKRFSSHIIVIGNNTITGQNAFLHSDDISRREALALLQDSIKDLQEQYRRKCININMVVIKDFDAQPEPDIMEAAGGFHQFSAQPNMVFSVKDNWQTMADYTAELNKKYRTQYNRARKKAEGIEKRLLSETEISQHNARIHELYLTVAENASFNTFYLPVNHFEVFKQQLGDDFLFRGYFLDEQLVGFNTLIKNNNQFEAYFLGYDAAVQKEKMLYLNMLYDFVETAISLQTGKVILGRSAMEIKSSVGAQAEQAFGFIKHTHPLLNLFTSSLFEYFEPKTEWIARNPFK